MSAWALHLPQLTISIFIYWLGIFTYSRNIKSNAHTAFFILAFTSATWLLCYYFAYGISYDLAKIMFRIGFSSAIFVGSAAYHFVSCHVNFKAEEKKVYLSYICSSLFLMAVWFSDVFIKSELQQYSWGYYPKANYLHPLYIFFLALLALRCYALLWNKYINDKKSGNDSERLKTKYVFIAIFLYSAAPIDFFINYGISIYPIGFLFAATYSSIMAYAIMKHQLLDIEIIIKRTAVFAGLFAFVYGVFTLITVLGQELFKSVAGWNQWVGMVPTVLIITLALRPLENFLTNVTEKFLFQKKYDYRDLLKTFTSEVLTVLDMQKLTEQTVLGLNKIIKLESISMLLLDKDIKSYRIVASSGVKDKNVFFAESDTVISYLKQTHEPILKDKAADQMDGHSHLKEDFKKLNAQLCLPITLHDEMTGVLCLGMKKSGEEFTEEDVDILMTLARTLAIALANAQLFDQLSKTQAEAAQREKMAVIGTLAAGINHEICNPLGIVRGQCEMFLLNLRDGLYGEKSKEDMIQVASEIMNKVIKETDRATAITKRLSGFAKPAKKVDVEEVFVEKEADEVLGLIGHDLKLNNIQFEKNFEAGFPTILADRRQIQEVLFNIIRNAAQAMDKKDGRIALSGISRNGTATIKIADNGSGIPADKMNQIFNPFFTTKEPGKGTGLGLFIVRQVIERNKGTIAVESQEGIGTTFTLTFPAAAEAKVLAA